MSLEDILKDIELRGKQELQELTLYYENKIKELEQKQSHALKSQEARIKKASEEERRTAERTVVSSAEMEALNVLRSREGSLIEEATGKAELYLKNIRDRKDYRDTLSRMVDIAHRVLGEDCTIIISKNDAGLVRPGRSKVVDKEVDPYGGLKAESLDGTMELDLTISAILGEIHEKLVSSFYEYLGE